jgi:uncharacterized protein involved in outer membrane biogenesis
MRKAMRILLWVVLLFLIVVALALAALFMFADPNKLKPVIASEVLQRTGYRLVIEGNLSWSIYPQIGVKADHITLTSPGKQQPFMDLRRVNIAVQPMQLLRGINQVKGEVHITDVTLLNVHASSALVGLHWQDNTLILRPIQATMYGGSLSGTARGKDFSKTPAWNWEVTLTHVDIDPLLRDANGNNSKLKLSGTGQVKIVAATLGNSTNEMLSNLNGSTEFSLTKGIVEGVDLNYFLKTADAIYNKQPIEIPQQSVKQTAFDSFTGTMMITNGLAQTNNLLLTSSAFKVRGQGNYNLPHQSLDLSLNVASQEELTSQWSIPLLVTGDLAKPDVRLDMREINKVVAENELARIKAKVKEKIKDKIPGKAGEYLQTLLGD